MGRRANPAFAVGAVAVPVAALVYALLFASVAQHTYVHVMAGVLWTGIDLFMAAVLGPVLGGLSVEERASVFERFTPKMAFLMPSLALVTIFGGVTLADRIGVFPYAEAWIAILTLATTVPALLILGWQFDAFDDPRWIVAFAVALLGGGAYLAVTASTFGMTSPTILLTLAIVTVLTVLGFGVLLPGEVRIYLQLASGDPDSDVISRIGMRNARLSGLQGLFQLAIVVVMVYLRWGGI
ncbi:hypothetical protein [Haloplanus salilacus]|uniref:hypothetical protein n=1 Tax=Haloplanus salilacus TaxID=2949994 RepID=UPI003CCE323E